MLFPPCCTVLERKGTELLAQPCQHACIHWMLSVLEQVEAQELSGEHLNEGWLRPAIHCDRICWKQKKSLRAQISTSISFPGGIPQTWKVLSLFHSIAMWTAHQCSRPPHRSIALRAFFSLLLKTHSCKLSATFLLLKNNLLPMEILYCFWKALPITGILWDRKGTFESYSGHKQSKVLSR